MDFAAEVARQRAEILARDSELKIKDLKIQALTLELAHHKRIRFGHKNEAFTPEQLDVEPAKFFVHRRIRPQYACRACETVVAAPVPPAVIDGGLAAPGLHAWVLIQKYQDHLPLYRIEQISERHGVAISRSTLAEYPLRASPPL